jgi:TRAP-type C4-dicarboxylate transport system substrate-binding protein
MALGAGLRGLCYYDAGFRSFYSRKRVIKSPADLAGLTIRVQRSPIMVRLVEVLGGRAEPLVFSDVYSALATGRVDGAENNIPSYYSEKHYEVAPYFAFDEHAAIPDIVLIHEKTWTQLRPEHQAALLQAAMESSRFEWKNWKRAEQEAMAAMKAAGVTFVYPDKKPFVEKAMPLYKEFGQGRLREYIRRIQETQSTAGNAPDVAQEEEGND